MAGISHGTTDQVAMDFSTKTIFMRCMKALNISFFLGCSCICTNQHNKSLFSNSFIICLMPTWIENMVERETWGRTNHRFISKVQEHSSTSVINREVLELHTKRNLKLQLVNSTSSEPRPPPL